jgi:hypothetical protein
MAKRRSKQARKTSGAAQLHESLAPTRERRRQGPVEDAGTLSDARGQIGAPYRAIDTLERMTRAGTISAEQRDAGERFREDFARAHLEPLTVPRLDRIPGQHTPLDTSNTVIGAREAIHRALLTLGGMTTPVAEVAWAVLGEGRTLKEWCALRPWGRNGRGMKPETASGILIAALSLLASHYGLTRRGR